MFRFVEVSDEEAMVACRRLAREEGLFAGFSSGANIAAGRSSAYYLFVIPLIHIHIHILIPSYSYWHCIRIRSCYSYYSTYTYSYSYSYWYSLLVFLFLLLYCYLFALFLLLLVALKLLGREEFRGKTVVLLLCDSGMKYLSTDLWE